MSTEAKVILEKLGHLKDEKGDWIALSKLIRDVLVSETWVDAYQSPAEWLRASASASGYSAGMVKRMQNVLPFLEGMAAEAEINLQEHPNASFASMEILKRMHGMSEQGAKDLFRTVLNGSITVRNLRERYEEIVRNKPGSARASQLTHWAYKHFEEHASGQIIKHLELLTDEAISNYKSNPPPRTFGPFSNLFFRVDAVAVIKTATDSTVHFDAFDFKLYDQQQVASNMLRLIERTSLLASFFRRFWIVLPAVKDTSSVLELRKTFLDLSVLNVGIVGVGGPWSEELEFEDGIQIYMKPSGDPWPDRRTFIAKPDDR